MYMVGDKVKVRALLRDGTPSERIWVVWLTELIPRRDHPNDPLWAVRFTRSSHSTLIMESMIEGKISSNFEGYNHDNLENLASVASPKRSIPLSDIMYSVGDKVEFTYHGKKYTTYLVAITPLKEYKGEKFDTIWEIKDTKRSHAGLIGEKQIIRKISSGFEGYRQ